MHSVTAQLLKAADVIEKCAAYFEQEENEQTEKQAQHLKTEFLDPIKESVVDMDPKLSEKLASTDPDILKLIKTLSVSQDLNDSDNQSLGGSSEKLASDDQDPLLAFCLDD